MSAGAVRARLERHGLRPRRDLGQNFLVDAQLAAQLVERAGVGARDTVIEIGAGLGVLTHALCARAQRVVAVEVDAGLVRALEAEGLPPNAELVHGDVLRLDLAGLLGDAPGPLRVVANLPYSISSPVLRRLLALRHRLEDWSVLLQREVALRLLAGPGSRDYGSLAVLHRLCTEVRRLGDLRPACFWPPPRVMSTHLRIRPRADTVVRHDAGGDELEQVERVVRAAFGTRRKQLANALRTSGLFPDADLEGLLAAQGVAADARAEALAPEALLNLARALTSGPEAR